MTGELYQPVRVFYQVAKKNAVLGRFKRLRCIDYDQSQNRWLWHYKEEAKDIKFTKSYREIPKKDRPVVLGYFTWKTEEEKQKATFSYLEKQMKQTNPEVEELNIHFYEDGIEAIEFSLKMRILEATEHWKGNKNFSYFDIMERFIENTELEDF